VKRKLAYFHHYQTRSRGLDQPKTCLSVIKEEEDSDTEASGSWPAAIPRCENHKVGPRIDVWAEENTMSSLLMDRGGRKFLNGDKGGPPLRHPKQRAAAQDVGLKLRPQAANLTPNNHFILYIELLEGGARSQADQLQERMQKELDLRNAMELAEYTRQWQCTRRKWQTGTPCPWQVGDPSCASASGNPSGRHCLWEPVGSILGIV
jgi:hypothetical protein